MVLATGNKSELAVGYATLYGDMCGGLAVLADVPKTLVYRIARHLNADGEVIPESTLTKPPSAELRPDQTDQDNLPPYDVLDRVVAEYVERNRSVDQIVDAGLDREDVERVVGLINRSEYKRRQAAPGIKITAKAFGIGRRYPIAAEVEGGSRETGAGRRAASPTNSKCEMRNAKNRARSVEGGESTGSKTDDSQAIGQSETVR
jgi:hypothetical protein